MVHPLTIKIFKVKDWAKPDIPFTIVIPMNLINYVRLKLENFWNICSSSDSNQALSTFNFSMFEIGFTFIATNFGSKYYY